MIKKVLSVTALSLVIISCGGANSEANKKAADKICACMNEKKGDGGEFDNLMVDFNYALCALDGITEGADVASDDFTKTIAEVCPDLKEAQENYVKSSKEANK